jgi:hypothetical protein
MLQPEGKKTESWGELFKEFQCPTTERPYLATRFN